MRIVDRPEPLADALHMLLAQGIIDDLEIRPDDEFPYRVTLPVGIVPMASHQARNFALGAAVGWLGPSTRP